MGAIEKSDLRKAITDHYNALRHQSEKIDSWGVTIWFDPVTPAERSKFNTVDDDMERSVVVLIDKAQHEDGSKCFTVADKGWMLRESAANIVQFTAQRILLADMVSVDDLKKPSPPTTGA